MASTLCQKLLTIFCQKAQNFVWFGPYDFVPISPACGSNTYQNNVWGDFRLPMSASAMVT